MVWQLAPFWIGWAFSEIPSVNGSSVPLAGEGESISEALFAMLRRFRGAAGSMAEAYGWGKAAGMVVPSWLVDGVSRLVGVDV